MCNLLERFWGWSKMTPEEYAEKGMDQNKGEFEDEFPLFDEMVSYGRELVKENVLGCDLIDELLTIMALDNECEFLLDFIEENSTDEQIKIIIEVGMRNIQPNARWQLAELLSRRKPDNYMEKLWKLSKDENNYVKRRAENCIECLKTLELEKKNIVHVPDNDENGEK